MSAAYIEPWVDAGLCAQVGGDLWFPEHGLDISVSESRDICNGIPGRRLPCPVRDECLAYALKHDIAFGVWGGKSPAERRRIKKKAAAS